MGERIALGFGDNIDYEIFWDTKVFESLLAKYSIKAAEMYTTSEINSVRDLLISILGFISRGVGGERFVSSPEIITEFSEHFSKKITLGGTSVRAAVSMRKLGYTSAFHLVTYNDQVRSLIPGDCTWVCSSNKDSLYPHLIIQFNEGVSIAFDGTCITAKHANRIIYNHDYDNIMMQLDPAYSELLHDAEVFLISGFNAMQEADLLAERLKTVIEMMKSLPEDAIVCYEDACFHKPGLSRLVRDTLIPIVDVYSLNEDEMQEYLENSVQLLNPEAVYEEILKLHVLLPVPVLIIHTRYWALAFGEGAEMYAGALKGGITMATARLRFGDDFTVEDYQETEKSPAEREGNAFSRAINKIGGTRICCLPSVQAEEDHVTTIGLGDAFVGGFLPALADLHKK